MFELKYLQENASAKVPSEDVLAFFCLMRDHGNSKDWRNICVFYGRSHVTSTREQNTNIGTTGPK